MTLENTTGTFLFCSAQMVLPTSGELLLTGGDIVVNGSVQNRGVADVNIFDPLNNSLRAGAPMKRPRWYGTATVLPSGEVYLQGGTDGEDHPEVRAEDGSATGKASFGFVSRYQKGATAPTGSTEFQFRDGGLTFHSTSYQWLVVAGARAQYKGEGEIAGAAGSYVFLITAIDGALAGGGGADRFRIKLWDKVTGAIVYDNQIGQPDDSGAATTLGSGSIVIHK